MGEKKKSSDKTNSTSLKLKIALPVISSGALLLTLLLIIASGYFSYGKWISDVESARLTKLSELQLTKRAFNILHYIQEQQKQLATFAARASTVSAAENPSSSISSSVKRGLLTAYPNSLQLRLLSLQREDRFAPKDPTTPTVPLSFTELDMINRALEREPVTAEAVRFGDTWQLIFIAPVAVSEQSPVVGTLLVSLPATELFSRIAQLEPELGETRLLRRTSRKPALIFKTGTATQGATQQQQIGDSQWLIEFTPSDQLASQATESPTVLLALHIIFGAVLLGGVYWITGRLDPQRKPPQTSATVATSAAHAGTLAQTTFEERDILDIQVATEDEGLLGLQDTTLEVIEEDSTTAAQQPSIALPDEVFRAYDIRGIAGTQITEDLAELVGQAVASEALAAGDTSLFVARDGRNHSPSLCEAVIRGVLSTGCDVINLGRVPTPLLYFATCELPESNSAIMVTASHNAAEYNGFKMVIDGRTLVEDDVQQIKTRILNADTFQGEGTESAAQVIPQYIDRIFSDVALAGDVKIVIDAGNGVTGEVAPLLFEELGCDVVPLYCDIDGNFPNHDPDPTIEANLQDLISTVKEAQADLGVAFDGDGDRLVFVTPKGQIIWPDRLLMLFAKDIVSRNPGADVIFDVKCTRELNSLVSSYGGRPIMWKTGHSNMKSKMQETGALIGGELSGHIFIKDRWYGFDDGMYAAARLLEIMTLRDQDIDSLFESFPMLPATPEIKIAVAEEDKFSIIEQLIQSGDFQNGKPITIDGLRVDFPKGWGLVRASNTSAALTLRFEAETDGVLEQLQQLFKRELLKVDDSLNIPF